jgi:hypothetical protein
VSLASVLCDLAACLCAELTPPGASEPDLCFCDVVPGSIFAHDYAWECEDKCGAAWVRLASGYNAEGVGVPSVSLGCTNFVGIDIEVGVIRCLVQEEAGQPPLAENMNAAATQQIADMLAMRRAIKCCEALVDLDYILGVYQPTGPQGMIVGGTWTITLAI